MAETIEVQVRRTIPDPIYVVEYMDGTYARADTAVALAEEILATFAESESQPVAEVWAEERDGAAGGDGPTVNLACHWSLTLEIA